MMDELKLEQLLADYVSESLNVKDRALLDELFAANPKIKQEADELAAMMKDLAEYSHSTDAAAEERMDGRFYSMLGGIKDRQTPGPVKVVRIRKWIMVAAATFAVLIAIKAGQYFSSEKIERSPKTTVARQTLPASQQDQSEVMQKLSIAPARNRLANHVKPDRRKDKKTAPPRSKPDASDFTSARLALVLRFADQPVLTESAVGKLKAILQTESDAGVRMMALDILTPHIRQNNVEEALITALSTEKEDGIQSAIIDLLIQTRSRDAVPAMLAVLNDRQTAPINQEKIKTNIETFIN